MKPVSAAYRKSMLQTIRNRSFVRVTMYIEDPTAIHDGAWRDNGAVPYSGYGTVDFAFDYGPTYATLELNRWTLDGSQLSLPAVRPSGGYTAQGFVSDKVSGADGYFSTPGQLYRVFALDHALHGVTLTFDSRCNEWPLVVAAKFKRGGEVLEEVEVPVTSLTAVVLTEADYVDELEISFPQCLPYHRPRVEYVLYGVQVAYGNADLASVEQSHDVDPMTRRLPKETARVTLLDYGKAYDPDNPAGVFRYVEEKARLRVQHGYAVNEDRMEWLRPDEYLLDGKPTTAAHKATFSANGMIGSLSEKYYKDVPGVKSMYDLAEAVLLDAGLTPTSSGGHPWEIHNSLRDIYTSGVLPIDTHPNCLKLIAHACRCQLFTDDENIIHIEPFGVTVKGIYAGVYEDNGHTWYSEWESVDSGNEGLVPFTSLELNRWALDGSMSIISQTAPEKRGYTSEGMMGSNGSPTTAPVFTKTFDVSHDLSVLAIRFDDLGDSYPRLIQVRYFQGSTLMDTRIEEVLDATAYVNSDKAEDCTKIEVTMLEGLPYQRFRVSKVYYREDDFSLDFNTIGEDSLETTKIDKLKAVEVAVYGYQQAAQITELYKGETTLNTLHIEFSNAATGVQISVTGGTLISSKVYGRAADLVLSSGSKTVVVTGHVLEQSKNILTHTLSTTGEVDTEDNPLVTDHEMAQKLAEHFATYLTMRNTYDVSYRGNPELETGDVIGLQTDYTSEMDALILVDQITFDGGLHGKMKVKGLI